MQWTWWPEAGTIIVTGPYCWGSLESDLSKISLNSPRSQWVDHPFPIFSITIDQLHYGDVIMSTMASQITGVSQAQFKENTKAPRHWPFWGELPLTGGFPSQRTSNAENVSIQVMTSSWLLANCKRTSRVQICVLLMNISWSGPNAFEICLCYTQIFSRALVQQWCLW